MSRYTTLPPARLLFPLALVLFEFSVYIANDMIQPGMILVVHEFNVGIGWIPTAMSAFLIGGALLPWLMGPLSDHWGRRPVMLGGVVLFILSCLAVLGIHDIHRFILLRVLQGMGLCFISAVGYATIQEAFEEKTAVKVTALMANIALIAPLVGPVAGAALAQSWSWRGNFMLIAALSAIALIGLWIAMPETIPHQKTPWRLSHTLHNYRTVWSSDRFIGMTLCLPLVAMPLMGWIALSPVILVRDAGMSLLSYGLWQIPVFCSLIAGNVLLVRRTDRWPLGRSVLIGHGPLLAGGSIAMFGSFLSATPQYFLIAGTCLMAFGEGLSFAVLYRFALTATTAAKGTTAASMTMLSLAVYAGGVECLKTVYLLGGIAGFSSSLLILSMLYFLLTRYWINIVMAERTKPNILQEVTD
jgi:MFS transporter, DHA1 family, multidrug/chloramphenicol efflux transport protein